MTTPGTLNIIGCLGLALCSPTAALGSIFHFCIQKYVQAQLQSRMSNVVCILQVLWDLAIIPTNLLKIICKPLSLSPNFHFSPHHHISFSLSPHLPPQASYRQIACYLFSHAFSLNHLACISHPTDTTAAPCKRRFQVILLFLSCVPEGFTSLCQKFNRRSACLYWCFCTQRPGT